jgi:phosphatidate cytidylyltransferase
MWLLRRSTTPALVGWGITVGAAFYTGGLLFYGPRLRGLDQGRDWLFVLMAVTFAADTAAFFVGRRWGRRRLAPVLSPSKTWEGAAAGVLGGAAAGAACAYGFDLGIGPAAGLALGGLMGVVGQLGDLGESALKRRAGVKDSGRLIPGHGGVLDRLDSIVFNLVLVYYFVIWAL